MKKIYLLSAVALMGLASCNDFDDQFHLGNQIGDKKEATIELTDADYASISNLATNKALAAELDKSITDGTTPYTDALKALKDTKSFGTLITADQFLPAFIQDKYPEADLGSKFKVTYNEYCGKSEYLKDFNSLIGEVTLSADDYNTAWEGNSTATYLTPATIGKMSAVLDERLPDVEEGNTVVVNYAYSDFEPAGGGTETPSDGTTKIADVIANTDGGEYAVKGIVCATYRTGFLLKDNTGYILVYKSSNVNIGDEVKVTGTTTQYGGLMQFPAKNTELTIEVTKAGKEPNFKHPTPKALAAADFEAYSLNPYVAYVTYQGKLSITTNSKGNKYYNVTISGTEKQGSLANVPDGLVDESLSGKDIVVYGYAIGATGTDGKYLNTMVTSVAEASSAAKRNVMRAAANGGANKAAVYKYDGSKWKIYSTDGAKVIAAQPEWYSLIGSNTISKPANYFPTLLQREYPFAADGQKVAVAYRKAASTMAVVEYTFSATDGWAASKEYKRETTTFSKTENGIEARISVYINESLLGNEGGFKIYNVELGALSYVWQNTTGYGWKASAHTDKNYASESWVVSPAINFKKAEKPELVFDEAMNFLSGNNREDFISVRVSTDFDGENVAAATWETLNVKSGVDGSSWTFYTIEPISLAQYVGKNIHIAFVYKSTDEIAPTYEFKNFIVREEGATAE